MLQLSPRFFLIIFMLKNLRISQKCSNFAADFAL